MKTGKDLLGSIFPSNKGGNMEIIEYHGYHKIKVRFVNTGYETMSDLWKVRKGTVKDHSVLTGYEVGTIHKSNNFGEFEIIDIIIHLMLRYGSLIQDTNIPYAPLK